MATPLETIWQIEDSTDRTAEQKARDIALIKAGEWANLPIPMTVGAIRITGIMVTDTVVELTGSGGNVSWPLQLVNAPIAMRDNAGPQFDRMQAGWRTDVGAVLRDILGRFQ